MPKTLKQLFSSLNGFNFVVLRLLQRLRIHDIKDKKNYQRKVLRNSIVNCKPQHQNFKDKAMTSFR
jgi:hypothetical protein